MRSAKNIIFIVVILLVIAGEGYYLFTYYKQDKENIQANLNEIATVDMRIAQLEERYARHEESKKELALLQTKKIAIEEQLPIFTNKSKFTSDLFDYLSVTECIDAALETKESKVISNSTTGNIVQAGYSLSFVTTYDEARAFVEKLSNMYQTCSIDYFDFNTENRKEFSDKAKRYQYEFIFGDQMYNTGTTTINFSVFYRNDNSIEDEVYNPEVSRKLNSKPFMGSAEAASNAVEQGQEQEQQTANETTEADLRMLNPDFMLNIGDRLSSGDTYKLSGPGTSTDRYLGLSSTSNVEIYVTVFDHYYELTIRDKQGNEKHTHVEYDIKNPTFRINSAMSQVEDVMPSVHIYIDNKASTQMDVLLVGTLLDNIQIYDGAGKLIKKGQTRGNVSLT